MLWARSYRVPENQVAGHDRLRLTRTEPLYWFISGRGHLSFCRQTGRNWDNEMPEYRLPGVSFGGFWGNDGSLLWNLELRYWFLVTLTTLPGPIHVWHWRRHRRRRQAAGRGLCPGCGYDLRATPGRCP